MDIKCVMKDLFVNVQSLKTLKLPEGSIEISEEPGLTQIPRQQIAEV